MEDRHRYLELKQMLLGQLAHLRAEISVRMRAIRDVGTFLEAKRADPEAGSITDLDISSDSDIDLALVRINVATQAKITEAIKRLETGRYGICSDCRQEISAIRLKALPFAVRCKGCEEKREMAEMQKISEIRHRYLISVEYEDI